MVRDREGGAGLGALLGGGGVGGRVSAEPESPAQGVGAPKAFLWRAGEPKCDAGASLPFLLDFLFLFF